MQNPTLEALRHYVTAKDGQARFGPSTLSLTISHSNLSQKWIEIRFDLEDTIGHVKDRLYKHGGTPPESQKLQLFDSSGKFLTELLNERLRLRDYQVKNDYEIKIIDLDPNSLARGGWLENTALVEKYEMSDDVYEKRDNTVRKYKQQLAKEHLSEPSTATTPTIMDENLTVGKRCEVFPGGRRGEIKYVGLAVELGNAIWVGVALDEPLGKNDGSVNGKRYFTCPSKFGVMVKQENVQIGDYPIRGIDEIESDDEI